jgi:hypothetical protein
MGKKKCGIWYESPQIEYLDEDELHFKFVALCPL